MDGPPSVSPYNTKKRSFFLIFYKPHSQHSKKKDTRLSTHSRKRKHSSPPPRKANKCHGQVITEPEDGEDESDPTTPHGEFKFRVSDYSFNLLSAHGRIQQCERCIHKKIKCCVEPTGPCWECWLTKQGCSLMPVDKDGKLIHKRLTAEGFLEFRISQLKRTIEKGKRPARPSPNEKADALPSTTLAPLKQMTISTSSPVDTAAFSFPESPLDLPASGPAVAAHNLPAAACRSGCSATSSFLTSNFFVDVPHASKAIPGPSSLQPWLQGSQHLQASHPSHRDPPQTSDEGHNSARIASIENRLDTMEDFVAQLDSRIGGIKEEMADLRKMMEDRMDES